MSKNAINPTRQQDFAKWYQQVIQAADLAENAPVRGCMTIKPYGYSIWENIQSLFDKKLKAIGVQNAYFPLLIPLEFFTKEAQHIEGFAKECAVVTHHRLSKDSDGRLVPDGKLTNPYVIRPTSEAVIGNIVSKWINSYRDLPLKLNQWCNVMRWEMRPRLFLRTSEFLWQEGHTIFANSIEAQQDALSMVKLYYDFISNELAMPAIMGMKTEEEKFPGAKSTYTVEVILQDGKAIQAGTSHYLEQNFAKPFEIKFLGKDGKSQFAYTSSWGITTRLIGGIIMTHADDDGLVLPPAIAPYQVVVIPIIHNQDDEHIITEYCNKITKQLLELEIRTHLDQSEHSSANKIWSWIKKGVPIRLEVGIREIEQQVTLLARRDQDRQEKLKLPFDQLNQLSSILTDINNNLINRALDYQRKSITKVKDLTELATIYQQNYDGLVLINKKFINDQELKNIANQYSLSNRCIAYDSNQLLTDEVLIGRSY